MEALITMAARIKVESWINKHKLNWRIITTIEPARTVADAAQILGVDRSLIVKTLVLICRTGVYAVILSGDKRLDMAKLEGIAGDCRMAKRNEVEKLTGYPAGGVPPVALPEHVKVIMDSHVAEMELAYGGGGDENTLLELNPCLLKKILKNIIITNISI